jgi:sugar/nucleoside kinase (ribokinase family)
MNQITKGIGVVGSTTIDQIVTRNQRYRKLGGVTTYAGITYRRHGIPALVVSNLAKRDLKILDQLKAEKLDVFAKTTEWTTHFVNDIRGQRRDQALPQQAAPISAGQIQAVVDRVDGLHLGPLHPLDIDPAAINLLREWNRWVFLDVQGYTRTVQNQKIYPSVSERLTAGLQAARVVKANGVEYRSVLDFYRMDLAQLLHRYKIEEFVVTLGEKGGFVQTPSGEIFRYAAQSAASAVDPTGAGDVFFAAYIVSRFSHQMPIPDACRCAARIAAQQVEGKYITHDQLDLDSGPETGAV